MVLINRKSLIKLVICQLTCSFIIWISTKPLSLNHLQDLRLIKPRYDNLPSSNTDKLSNHNKFYYQDQKGPSTH